MLWAETDASAVLGADAIGALGKTSEAVGKEAAEHFFTEVTAKPTVDAHLADMLIPYLALAEGNSVYFTRHISSHLETNIWLVEKILKTRFKTERVDGLYRVERAS